MEQIVFKLTLPEARAVVTVLGQLPTNTNAWGLYQKVLAQLNEQTEDKDQEEVEAEDLPMQEEKK